MSTAFNQLMKLSLKTYNRNFLITGVNKCGKTNFI